MKDVFDIADSIRCFFYCFEEYVFYDFLYSYLPYTIFLVFDGFTFLTMLSTGESTFLPYISDMLFIEFSEDLRIKLELLT